MVGITSYGAYIPYYRLNRAEIARAWDTAALPGEKAVANYDEDSLTMAAAAAIDCTTDVETKSIDALYFASTTSPYREKQAAATIAVAVDLRREVFTADFSGSLRCGTNAVKVALDAVNGGSAKSALVCAADARLGYPRSDMEMSYGDGAAALMIGDTGVIAAIEGSYTISDEIVDVWRRDTDVFVRSWEDRFVLDIGYTRVVAEAVSAALKAYDLTPKDFAKAVFYAPSPRPLSTVSKKLGFDLETQVQDTLYGVVGNTGTASALMCLVAALEEAKAGDRILLAGYGNGCDVFILKVTSEIDKLKNRRGIKGYLQAKQTLSSYQKYLRWRNIVQVLPPARPDPEKPSAPALWRDTGGGLALHGSRCLKCGAKYYPVQRVCLKCGAKDSFEYYSFARKAGKLFTFCQDNLAVTPNPPVTVVAVDFPEGGRFVGDMTDCDPGEVRIEMPVEMTFRRIGDAGSLYNYWWKCRPLRF